MSEFVIRTEELTNEQISKFYVSSAYEQTVIDKLKAPSPVLLVGSRGVGKSFLFKVSEIQLLNDFETQRVLPVSLTFRKASLINATSPNQFQSWMLARICSELVRALKRLGLINSLTSSLSVLSGESIPQYSSVDLLVKEFEDSWRNPNKNVDISNLPSLDTFIDSVQDICEEHNISRIVLNIDEAAHVFLPQQQREFFTLFRDLRSPYIKCNAAVYPGVTVYGDTFEPIHDAVMINLLRNVNDENYISNMKAMVLRQVNDSNLATRLSQNGENFTLLAYAASGNPRYLLNSVAMAERMDSKSVNQMFREYYRESQWAEHTKLAERFPGYKVFIDWGRDFLEKLVIPELKSKNDDYLLNGNGKGTTFYFWLHNNAPQEVREALRILEYSGLVYEDATGIRATRSEVGTRYMVNIGCLLASEAVPTTSGLNIIKNVDIRRMSEYGANQTVYSQIQGSCATANYNIIKEQLDKSIDLLELTEWQKQKMHDISINTIGDLISTTEACLKKVKYISDVRARNIMNAGIAAVFEYLIG